MSFLKFSFLESECVHVVFSVFLSGIGVCTCHFKSSLFQKLSVFTSFLKFSFPESECVHGVYKVFFSGN